LRSNDSLDSSTQIIVIGAGLAGATAAAVLGQQGRRVILLDPRPSCPPVFKAEKIEPDQAQLFRQLGLLEHLLPQAARVREIRSYYNGRLFGITPVEQYGMYYSDMVNAMRAHLPASVEFKLGRVVQISNCGDLQRVRTAEGEELACRLVVLACGLSAEIQASLGLRRVSIQKDQSVAMGFTISRPGGLPFPFDALTYHPTSRAMGVDYLSLFPIGQTMRANLFAFPAATDEWVRQFISQPTQMLERCLPKLQRAIGEYRVVGKVEAVRTHLYRMEGDTPPGIVLIGDALQNSCPSTGTGLTKVLTDVEVMCSECVTPWFATPGMGTDKLKSFFDHPRKLRTDAKTLENAHYRRRASTDPSLRWRIHRIRLHLARRFGRPASG
jgi:2-polyprenyl-6-methoxyphenol hydroxylase-like FAD-dependent oxidoreductase